MKKIFRVIITILLVFIIGIIYMSCITNNNQDYLTSITKDIQKNYHINEKIIYSNKYGNYYIFKTNSKVIVLNHEYKEVLKESTSKIKELSEDYPLIYKTNKLMYEHTITNNNKITYKYYDAKTGDLIKTTTMEKK